MSKNFNILAIDPGRSKWGEAVVSESKEVLHQGIYPLQVLYPTVENLVKEFQIKCIALGNQTGSALFETQLEPLGVLIYLVDERYSSLEARKLFFLSHPPVGWRRFIPMTMLTPERDYDDYSAILLAKRFLAKS
jgi:RNase H-fold protein (predicted Holliday junction resolvase)